MLKLLALVFGNLGLFHGYDFIQNDYTISIDRGVVEFSNAKYFEDLKLENSWFNRTTRTLSFSFKLLKEITNNVYVTAQAYKYVDNQYKMYAPIRVNIKVCQALEKNYFGVRDMLKYGNMTLACPVVPGFYDLKNLYPNATKLPPRIPIGRFKGDFTFFDKNVKIFNVSVYILTKSKKV